MSVKWIKLSVGMFDDEKIKLIEQMPDADTILVVWVKLLAQAGKTNASGYIYLSENIPYTDEMLAAIFNRPLGNVRMALGVFKQFGMIEIDDESFISVSNWEKHQNVEGLDKIREQARIRQAKYRNNKRIGHMKDDTEDVVDDSNVTVTSRNALEEELELELEQEVDKEKDKNTIAPSVAFDEWWNLYNKKVDKKKCLAKYKLLLRDYTQEIIMSGTENYLGYLKKLSMQGEFVPNQKNPLTFLNGENFNDDYTINPKGGGRNGAYFQTPQSNLPPEVDW